MRPPSPHIDPRMHIDLCDAHQPCRRMADGGGNVAMGAGMGFLGGMMVRRKDHPELSAMRRTVLSLALPPTFPPHVLSLLCLFRWARCSRTLVTTAGMVETTVGVATLAAAAMVALLQTCDAAARKCDGCDAATCVCRHFGCARSRAQSMRCASQGLTWHARRVLYSRWCENGHAVVQDGEQDGTMQFALQARVETF